MSRLIVITGPMKSGKSELLLRYITRADIAKRNFLVIQSGLNTRDKNFIKSRNGISYPRTNMPNVATLDNYIENLDKKLDYLFIDEIQFFESEIIKTIKKCIINQTNVICSGLDLDFKGDTFGIIGDLLALADEVIKLTAICQKCKSDFANRTQRLINGNPAPENSPVINIEGETYYEPRCINCHIVSGEI